MKITSVQKGILAELPWNTRTLKTVIIAFLCCSVCFNTLNAQLFSKVDKPPLTQGNQKSFGTGWVDYDNDGDLDLFVANMGDDNELYRNIDGSSFLKLTSKEAGSIVQDGGQSFTMSWADFNNDGRLDVFVGNFGEPSFLYTQTADHKFMRVHQTLLSQHVASVQGSSWVDLDLDGDLDLFLATKDQKNIFFENDGKGAFSSKSNLKFTSEPSNSHGVAWADINGDNYPDLLLAENVEGNNSIFTSNKNVAGDERSLDSRRVSIGASWIDYDNDLDLDLFVTNAMGKADYLYENVGNGKLNLLTDGPIVETMTNSMGACWGDYDNDGDLDAFVANSGNQENSYFENMGSGKFVLDNSHIGKASNSSRGCSAGDFDNDGDLDLFVTNGFGENDQNEFYTNNGNNSGWVKLRLIGKQSAIPIGAQVRIVTNTEGQSLSQLRDISAQTGAYGHNSFEVHFGVGTAKTISELTIQWPNGQTQSFNNLEANVIYRLKQGEETFTKNTSKQ